MKTIAISAVLALFLVGCGEDNVATETSPAVTAESSVQQAQATSQVVTVEQADALVQQTEDAKSILAEQEAMLTAMIAQEQAKAEQEVAQQEGDLEAMAAEKKAQLEKKISEKLAD